MFVSWRRFQYAGCSPWLLFSSTSPGSVCPNIFPYSGSIWYLLFATYRGFSSVVSRILRR